MEGKEGENLIWNRGSKLIGCEVQGTLAPYVEEPNKTENVVTFDQASSSSSFSLPPPLLLFFLFLSLPRILLLAVGAPVPLDRCRFNAEDSLIVSCTRSRIW